MLSTYDFLVKLLAVAGPLVTVADVNAACAAVVNPIVVLFNVPALETKLEKVPFLGVVPPTVTLSNEPTERGLIVRLPLACGLIVTDFENPFKLRLKLFSSNPSLLV